jgi:hypothetical protein
MSPFHACEGSSVAARIDGAAADLSDKTFAQIPVIEGVRLTACLGS